jgi:hypothetical protein
MRENNIIRTLSRHKAFIALAIVVLIIVISFFARGGNDNNTASTSSPVATSSASASTQAPQSTPTQENAAPTATVSTPASTGNVALTYTVVPDFVKDGSYDRTAFGTPWKDVDHNSCDTRNDILKRDLTNIVYKAGDDCVIMSGTLNDPYTGKVINFERGPQSAVVQVDHIQALGLAWYAGARNWTDEQREALANDPENLTLADGEANRIKSDSGPGEWMPPRAEDACTYVTGFAKVAEKYKLNVQQSDDVKIREVLATC